MEQRCLSLSLQFRLTFQFANVIGLHIITVILNYVEENGNRIFLNSQIFMKLKN